MGLSHQAVGHLVARGIKGCSNMTHEDRIQALGNLMMTYKMPAWGVAWITVTVLLFMIAIGSANYTIGDVVATLMMVETPPPKVVVERTTVKIEEPDAPLEKEPLMDTESVVIAPKPVTRSARTTIRHITRLGGWRARWRGLNFHIVYTVLTSIFFHALSLLMVFPNPLMHILGSIIFARFHMAWTHSVIVHPDSVKGLSFRQRLPPRRDTRKIWLPMAIFGLAQQLTVAAPIGIFFLTGMNNGIDLKDCHLPLKVLAMIVSALIMAVGILLPAHVTLIRMEASLLPDEYDTIVPFDRTFSGKVVPAIIGGSGVVSYFEAWRSFAMRARFRLIRVYTLLAIAQTIIFISLAAIVVCQVALIMGDKFDVVVRGLHSVGHAAMHEIKNSAPRHP